jgi:murein DD-endopeptidase MepM/ murein hydrolase activator NlpD
MIDRRQFLAASAACLAATMTGAAAAAGSKDPPVNARKTAEYDGTLEISVQPGRVFKRSADQNRLRQEYWLFLLVLRSPEPRTLAIDSLALSYSSAGVVKRVTTYPGSAAAALNLASLLPQVPGKNSHAVAAFQVADAVAQALAIDGARCELTWRSEAGVLQRVVHEVPIEAYTQRTDLVFPFRGRGMITQGGAWNDGHRNRSGMFAIDAIGLTDAYAPMIKDSDAPDALAGWGRQIIAPAAGKVVVARNDRPDQPVTGISDPKYFVPEFPQGGDPGNHCVIDHGSGEFSMLAHFQKGSLRVRVGDRVTQGQVLGLLGNSGDSSSPHVHHQLQSAANWVTADALPHVYMDGPERKHDRGVIFTAR